MIKSSREIKTNCGKMRSLVALNNFYIPGALEHAPVLELAFECPTDGPEQHQPCQPAPDQALRNKPYQPGQVFPFEAECEQRNHEVHQHEDKVIARDL